MIKLTKIFLFSIIIFYLGFISSKVFALEVTGSTTVIVGNTPIPTTITPDLRVSVNAAYVVVNNSKGPVTLSYNSPYTLSWGPVANASSCLLDGFYNAGINGGSVTWGGAVGWTNNSHDFILTCTALDGSTGSDTVNLNYPPTPKNISSSCNADGTVASMSWTYPSGYSLAYTRAQLISNSSYVLYNDNASGNVTGISITPNTDYRAWVHTRNTNGAYSNGVFTSIINCPAPSNPVCVAPQVLNTVTNICEDQKTCILPQILNNITNICENSRICATPQILNQVTNTCEDAKICIPPQALNSSINTCEDCVAPKVFDPKTKTCGDKKMFNFQES